MLLRLLKSFGMKNVKAVVDAYPNDGDMAKKPNNVLFQLGREIAIGLSKLETGPDANSSFN